jgi:hypothetical protein
MLAHTRSLTSANGVCQAVLDVALFPKDQLMRSSTHPSIQGPGPTSSSQVERCTGVALGNAASSCSRFRFHFGLPLLWDFVMASQDGHLQGCLPRTCTCATMSRLRVTVPPMSEVRVCMRYWQFSMRLVLGYKGSCCPRGWHLPLMIIHCSCLLVLIASHQHRTD